MLAALSWRSPLALEVLAARSWVSAASALRLLCWALPLSQALPLGCAPTLHPASPVLPTLLPPQARRSALFVLLRAAWEAPVKAAERAAEPRAREAAVAATAPLEMLSGVGIIT